MLSRPLPAQSKVTELALTNPSHFHFYIHFTEVTVEVTVVADVDADVGVDLPRRKSGYLLPSSVVS